ncbi:MAG: metal ABC transporter substrate-binding protein [Chloroflexota bacterium]|nr:metal ABC transporter substrate-binding protein [Chloroflexota bacterium]
MRLLVLLASLLLVLVASALLVLSFGPAPFASAQTRLQVVSTVAPITNIVRNVGGERIDLEGLVPPGVDSHTFEPSPSDARKLAVADLIIVNGLALEGTTIELAEANLKSGARILELGPGTITRDEWVFDFSFPEEYGDPNPHVWMNPLHAARYAELVRDALSEMDPANADVYAANTELFRARVDELDRAIIATVATIPEENRKLLTYHDSFAYFAPRYGFKVIGAIQPSDFAEPSPREVAALIDQIRYENVPAIFGSEVFPSPVLEQIGRETGVRYYDTLRDDDPPGEPGSPENTYFGMLQYDVQLMARALGGDPSPLDWFDPSNTYRP